jgi:glycerophosphoryl diester phosphodiesterase
MIYQAHRGVCTECPENTVPAFRKAWEQGYQIMEMDPSFTSDDVCVLHHDLTVNRTCRTAQGETLPEGTRVSDLTWEQLKALDAGIWFSEAFRGTPVPTLAEILALCRNWGVHVKMDNKYARFPLHQQKILFDVVEASGADVGFTCFNPDMIRDAVARFPKATIHYDGPVSEENLEAVKALLKENPLVVWLPMDVDWCKMPAATPELCALAKQYGRLGLWILSTQEQDEKAKALGADIIETPGQLKP